MKNLVIWVGIATVLGLLGAVTMVRMRGTEAALDTASTTSAGSDLDPRGALAPTADGESAAGRVSLTAEAEPPPPGADRSDPTALLRGLTACLEAGDLALLGRRLEASLADPALVYDVLAQLERGAWDEDPAAAQGALVLLEAALQYAHRLDGGDADGGRPLVDALLQSLPRLSPDLRGQLIHKLSTASAGGKPILDLTYLSAILDLRAAHPELSPEFSELFAHMADGLAEGEDRTGFYALLANESTDPVAVRVALAALLTDEEGRFLALAEQLYADAESDVVRDAVLGALVTAAPVDRAAEVFGRLARGAEHAEAILLGSRPGGLEALSGEYEHLLGSGSQDTVARQMLVAGMAGAAEAELLDIALRDPDSSVRGQALLTATLAPDRGPAVVELLRDAVSRSSDPSVSIPPSVAVFAAGNLIRGDVGGTRADTVDLLVSMAANEDLDDAVRWQAVEAVRDWAPPGGLDGLVIGGQAVD
ncbi:MAG: hypothetical protein QF903_12970 [Planctomycetota bacterium]|nr:hypothetical protein [Planctomycetota bacterium]MDP6763777.1 hypothetical protein [Planctomycetota bacterium]MDP6990375.1 hypothetical protein [Planctomycetota bacterium]